MTHDEIVNALRENAEWCDANEYDVPLCMGDNQRAAADLIESLQAQLAESQRREQAAVDDIMCRDHCDVCVSGKEHGGECKKADYNCLSCKSETCMCRDCRDEDRWQWRGPQEAGEGDNNAIQGK